MKDLENEIKDALDSALSSRGYDDHAYDREVYEEGLDDFTEAVLNVIKEAEKGGWLTWD